MMEEVRPGIYHLHVPIPHNPLGFLNTYLVAGDRGWVLIDTGWNAGETFNPLERQLQDLGIGFKDFAPIVITQIHSAGHICLYEPEHGILLSRDYIQSGLNPLGDYLRSLDKMGELKVDLALPAHEHVFFRLSRKDRADKERISWDVSKASWDTMSALDKRLAMTETLAHWNV